MLQRNLSMGFFFTPNRQTYIPTAFRCVESSRSSVIAKQLANPASPSMLENIRLIPIGHPPSQSERDDSVDAYRE